MDQDQLQAQLQAQANSATQILTSPIIGASNNDIANSIVTNTLLSSMKTGSPL